MSLSKLKWLYPGMRVKRWLALMGAGVLTFCLGLLIALKLNVLEVLKLESIQLFYAATNKYFSPALVGLVIMGIGVIMISGGLHQLNRSIFSVFAPKGPEELVNLVFQKQKLSKGFKVVAVGGGTGLSVLLKGLKAYTSNLTAVVTVADDGGSSGRLRTELGMLPPGDLRNCIVALADSEDMMTNLLQFRFQNGSLDGHNFGNLFIAAMSHVSGDFTEALHHISSVLAIRGTVLPSTLSPVTLCGELQDGAYVEGESAVTHSLAPVRRVYLKPENAKTTPEVLASMQEADAIIIGPGSLFTSLIPNLLLDGVPDAIVRSKAVKIYICNCMTQKGETDGFKVSDHVRAIVDHTGNKIFDTVLVNQTLPNETLLDKYSRVGAYPVEADTIVLEKMGLSVRKADLLDQSNVIRHDGRKLAKVLMELLIQKLNV